MSNAHNIPSPAAEPIGVPVSFEVYPPRKPELTDALHETIQRLATVNPAFISVTYGAGGSSRDATLDCVRYIRDNTSVEPMAHLTCVSATHAEATALVGEFLDAGVRSFLALRGDAPEGTLEGEDFLGDLKNATALVELIRELQPAGEQVTVGVATFPNGHPESTTVDQDIQTLLAKQAAGANVAITQLFFYAEEYLAFVEKAHAAGVSIPILPGIMPVISPARLKRMVEISGEAMPLDLQAALEAETTAEGQRAIGVAHAANLARELIAGGAPGIHLYAFNQSGPVLEVLQHLS
jgi:methylenetetrahydrofolate reductase (NADPH)